MGDIFISYRRADSDFWADRLADELRPHFRVFMDIRAIRPGLPWRRVLDEALGNCAALLVVIGPGWLNATDNAGRCRLDDSRDTLRQEIAESLKRDIPVFPLLVNGADMPPSESLPDDLKALTEIQGCDLTKKHWRKDVEDLIALLNPLLGPGQKVTPPASPGRIEAKDPELVAASVFRDAPDGPEMVVVPAGSFLMGSPEDEEGRSYEEGPQHMVTIARPFAVGKYAVTFDEWDAFVAASGTAHKPKDQTWGRGRRPVINVSWDDAQQYVAWLFKKTGKTYRLLSEAEWEYVARAGRTTRYPWGNDPGNNRANFVASGSKWSDEQTAPVGSFEPNAFGLHDMIGNVWEWVQDCWNESYAGAPSDGSAWESGDRGLRVLRGGSWDDRPEYARVATRLRNKADIRNDLNGFRVARTL